MPRSSGRSSGGGRRSSSSSSSAPSRSASTSAPASRNVPATQQHAPAPAVQQAPAGRSPGLFGQMASTAAGVAVGHTIGNGLSGMLFGGRNGDEPIPAAPLEQTPEQRELGGSCAKPAKDFTACLEATNGDGQSCLYFLDALKACQQANASGWA